MRTLIAAAFDLLDKANAGILASVVFVLVLLVIVAQMLALIPPTIKSVLQNRHGMPMEQGGCRSCSARTAAMPYASCLQGLSVQRWP